MLSQKQLNFHIKTQESHPQEVQEPLLDLSKKQLRKVQQINLNDLMLERIDLSYNFIKSFAMINITSIPSKKNISQSSIDSDANQQLSLKWLDLSFNVLEDIDLKKQQNSSDFKYLQFLNACTNKIQAVNLDDKTYPFIKQLHLKNNKIRFFMHCPQSLEVLTLDKNCLTELSFTGAKHLQILSAAHNKIEKLAIKTPDMLFLDMQDNQVLNVQFFYEYLESAKKLLSINMLQNPIDMNKDYKVIVLSTCPQIVQIDEVYINPYVRQGFRILKEQEKLEEVLERTTQNYKKKLQAQLMYKEQMLQKLRLQEKQIQEKFVSYCLAEKQQMHILEQHAKNTLGKTKFRVANQKEQFVQKIQQTDPNLIQKPAPKQNHDSKKVDLNSEQYTYQREYEDFQKQNAEKFRRQNLSKVNQDPRLSKIQPLDNNAFNKKKTQGNQEPPISSLSRSPRSLENNGLFANLLNKNNQNQSNMKNDSLLSNNKPANTLLKGNRNSINSYRRSRSSILSRGTIEALNLKGKEMTIEKGQKIESYKSLTKKSLESLKESEEEIIDFGLDDILDVRCLEYLEKYYSFYE